MNFAQHLRKKSDAKAIEHAKDFLVKVKPLLEKCAEEGHSVYRYTIESEQDKVNLHLFESDAFIEYLRKNLDGVIIYYGDHFKARGDVFVDGHPAILFSWSVKEGYL